MKRLVLAAFLLGACGACVYAQESVPGAAKTEESKPEESGDKWIVWKWANFAILLPGLGYLISKYLLPPSFFPSRTASIQKGISEAQLTKREAEKRVAEMEGRLNRLGAEIERFRTEAHAEMEQESARIREETRKQIEKLQQQAEQEIEAAGKTARRELKTYAAELALQLAEQRIRARLDTATETALVEGFIRDLKGQDNLTGQKGSQN
jgi:F-type H+-transporting ATPase subunit b